MKLRFGLILVAVALFAVPAVAGPFTNGGFETGPACGSPFCTLYAGNTQLTGWTVIDSPTLPGTGSIDWIGTYWQNAEGLHSIDLDGTSAGGVSQTFDTVAGQMYMVSFDMAGNPDGGPVLKVMVSNGIEFSFSTAGHSRANMGWEENSFLFTAAGSSTTLQFVSMSSGSYGAALDDIHVDPVPEPGSLLLLGSGLIGAAGFIRRKLGRG